MELQLIAKNQTEPKVAVHVATVEKQPPTPGGKSRKRAKRGGSKKKAPTPCWLASIMDPFDRPACHIPDDNTSESGVVKGWRRDETVITPGDIVTGPASISHNVGFVAFPFVDCGYNHLKETLPNSQKLFAVRDASASSGQMPVTNIASYGVLTAQTRVTAMGFRLTYTGAEVNRAGKYYAGLLPIMTTAIGNTANVADPLSVFGLPVTTGDITGVTRTYSIADIKTRMVHTTEGRVTDGVLHAVWHPAQTPSYVLSRLGNAPNVTVPSGTNAVSMYANIGGQQGAQIGQYALIVLIVGDNTTAAQMTGNTYSIQFTQHVEVMPDNVQAVTYPVGPSTYDVNAMMGTINAIGKSRTATTISSTVQTTAPESEPTFVSASDLGGSARSVIGDMFGDVGAQFTAGSRDAINSGIRNLGVAATGALFASTLNSIRSGR